MKFMQYLVLIVILFYAVLELDGIRQVMYDTYTKQFIEGVRK